LAAHGAPWAGFSKLGLAHPGESKEQSLSAGKVSRGRGTLKWHGPGTADRRGPQTRTGHN